MGDCRTEFCKHKGSCVKNSVYGFVRGAVIGLGVRAVIKIVMGLIKRTLIKNPALILKIFDSKNLKLVWFLSGMVGLKRSVLCLMRHLKFGEGISSFVAGFASGLPLVFEDSENRSLYSLYMLVRAGDCVCKYLVHNKIVPRIPKFIDIVYVVSLSILIYARVYHGESMNKGMFNLLNRIASEPNDMVYLDMTGYSDYLIKRR